VPGAAAEVLLQFTGLPSEARAARLAHFRIDEEHSNSFAAWKRIGSPQSPTPEQYAALEKAGQLATLSDSEPLRWENDMATLRFELPRQGVSLIMLNW
jgi:xylan 1,4-beta-xylosidase